MTGDQSLNLFALCSQTVCVLGDGAAAAMLCSGDEERCEACSRVAMVIPHYLQAAERFVCRGLTAYDCVAASSNNML